MTATDLKELREDLGWTQDDMARYLGLRHRKQAHDLESGRCQIRGAKLVLLQQLRQRWRADGFPPPLPEE
jgi:transcriptional regulator with XRE-family HTH domain